MANIQIKGEDNISNTLSEMILNPDQHKEGTMKHRMVTKKGDSGSPIFVQPSGMRGRCYVIGMHCSGNYTDGYKFEQNNTAVIITKEVKE